MRTIGLIGGTGDLGSALAIHLAKKYDAVIIGSRNKSKAESTVLQIIEQKKGRTGLDSKLIAASNEDTINKSDNLILTVPYGSALATVKDLSRNFKDNQLLISAVASIAKKGKEFVSLVEAHSVSRYIQETLPRVRVASAFQTVPAGILFRERTIEADVFVSCDSEGTFSEVAEIVSSIDGLRPLYAGTLETSWQVEGLTALLLNLSIYNKLKNPTFKIHSF